MPTRRPQTTQAIDALAVTRFWRAAGPNKWFAKNKQFDTDFRELFFEAHFAAARQELSSWLQEAEPSLALILLLDQYPRNAFRGTGHMFATDSLALCYARQALKHINDIDPALRNFICLPFMHSENLLTQQESINLYRQHAPESMYWAQEHHDIIARFGRFPHRNAALGRITTPAEHAYLDAGGFSG